jgi:CheY-like chemotaxis protein
MPLRVLVVEDEATNMQIIALSLAALGHRVIEAHGPEEGIVLAREHIPDVILMDMNFKGANMDGLEAIRRLKAQPETCDIPVVAQTAAVLDFSARTVAAVGGAGLLHKPYRRKQLVAAIEAALAATPSGDVAWHVVHVPGAPAPR